MATITPVAVAQAATTVTYAAASSGGDTVATGGATVTLHVRNASGGSVNVTLAGVVPCSQGSTHDVVVACPVGDTEVQIPAHCVNPTTHNVAVTYSASASVTVAATK